MTISKVGVVGAGSMGSGIANLAAISGFQVILHDVEQKFLDNGLSRINKFMEKSVAKGKMTEEQKKEVLERIQVTTNLEDFKQADIVIEAVIEDLEVKKKRFREIGSNYI